LYAAEVAAERLQFGKGVSGVPHFIVDGRIQANRVGRLGFRVWGKLLCIHAYKRL
jgi:hypothetical protein